MEHKKLACSDTIEIERKFLVDSTLFAPTQNGVLIQQGYIASRDRVSVRIRQYGDVFYLSVKAAIDSRQREEFEYQVPCSHGERMFASCVKAGIITKTRFCEPADGGLTWEVDVFAGQNTGLITAEIELNYPDQTFAQPAWLGDEVTDDPRYLNTQLAAVPFSTW